jgi:hypothetical protein
MAARETPQRKLIAFPIDLGVYITLVGLLFYGLSRLSLSMFYLPLGSEPEELGLDYARTLANVIGLLIVIPLLIAVLTALIVGIFPLRHFVRTLVTFVFVAALLVLLLPRILFVVMWVLIVGGLSVLFGGAGIVLVLAYLLIYYLTPPIAAAYLIFIFTAQDQERIPKYLPWVSLVGVLAFWLGAAGSGAASAFHLSAITTLLVIESYRPLAVVTVVTELDRFIMRVLASLPDKPTQKKQQGNSFEMRVNALVKAIWTHTIAITVSLIRFLDTYYDSPESVRYRFKALKIRGVVLRKRIGENLRQSLTSRRERLKGRFPRLVRLYFRALAGVLLCVVLVLFLIIPNLCYELGQAVSAGRAYVTLDSPAAGLWKSLLAFPLRAEPAQVQLLSNPEPPALNDRTTTRSALELSSMPTCATYLGTSNGVVVFHVSSPDQLSGGTLRFPVESIAFKTGEQARKACAGEARPSALRHYVTSWAAQKRAHYFNVVSQWYREALNHEWVEWPQTWSEED